jgi:hypothetical protein
LALWVGAAIFTGSLLIQFHFHTTARTAEDVTIQHIIRLALNLPFSDYVAGTLVGIVLGLIGVGTIIQYQTGLKELALREWGEGWGEDQALKLQATNIVTVDKRSPTEKRQVLESQKTMRSPKTTTCVWCLEEVKVGARVCKHCGRNPIEETT